jgi:hypothetical protein
LADAELAGVTFQELRFRRKLDGIQQLQDSRFGRLPVGVCMRSPRFAQLRPDPKHGIEGRVRALQHKADLPASNAAHLPFGQAQQVAPVEQDLAGGMTAFHREQPQNRQCDRAFAGTAGPHKSDDFAFAQVESDIAEELLSAVGD